MSKVSQRLVAALGGLQRCLGRFPRAERGSVSVELVLTLPLLLWALAATAVFYDGYRARYHAQMAAQTVADIMSRETDLFTGPYVEGLNGVFDFLADSRYPTRIRVSSVIWDSANERHRLQWSYGTRSLAPLPANTFELLQQGNLAGLLTQFGEDSSYTFASAASQMPVSDLADRIPPVLPGEALLLVETFALWEPFASVGLGRLRFAPVVAVRPRFAPWINFEGVEPVFPEANYELAWTGTGNESLPNPNEEVPPPPPTGPNRTLSFEDGVTTGFSRNTIVSGGPTGSFLGLFGTETWANPVTLDVDLQTAGTNATIAFDLLLADTWDGYSTEWALPRGDTFTLLIDGVPISMDPFQMGAGAPHTNNRVSGGYLGTMTYQVAMTRTRSGSHFIGSDWSHDEVWRVTLNLTNAPRNFSLGFSAGLDSAIHDESFGLDNVEISASGAGTAAPFTANAAAMLPTADPHTRFRRYTGCPEYRISAPWLSLTRADLSANLTMTREVGGQTNLGSCSSVGGLGYINASPHLVLNYDNQNNNANNSGLQITLNDGNNGRTCDSTLLIRDPNGQFWFNDDFSGWNAGLRINRPQSGQYVIWIGSYSRGSCTSRLTLGRY